MLARHHANGDMSDPLVLFELSEIEEALEHEKTARVGFRTALRGSGNRKRLAVVLLIATGSQLTGTGIFSYYLSPVLSKFRYPLLPCASLTNASHQTKSASPRVFSKQLSTAGCRLGIFFGLFLVRQCARNGVVALSGLCKRAATDQSRGVTN